MLRGIYQDFINAAHAKGLKVIQDVVFNHTGNFGETNLFPMIEKQGDLSSSDCMKTLPNSGLPTDYNQLLPARQYDARIEKMKSETGDPEHIYHHGLYYIELNNATLFDSAYFKIYDERYYYGSDGFSYSPLNYIARAYSSNSLDAKTKNLFNALYWFEYQKQQL